MKVEDNDNTNPHNVATTSSKTPIAKFDKYFNDNLLLFNQK